VELKPGFKYTEVGMIPEDWNVRLLPDVCRFRGGKAHEQYISDLGKFVCVNSKFISTDGKVRKHSTANFCCGKRNDVLMVMSDLPNGKALAKAFLVDAENVYAVNQRVCALTPYRDCAAYLFHVLNRNAYFLRFDDGVNQTHLLNPVFKKCSLPIPPNIREQEAIAEALSDTDALIASLDQLIAKKRKLKRGAMQELLTGKKRLVGFSRQWEVKRLGDVAETDPENLSSETRPSFAFNYVSLEDVDIGVLRSYTEQVFRTAPSRARRLLRKDDVLLSTVRPNLLSHLHFSADRDAWVCSTGFCVVRCKEGVTHPGFVYFHLFAGCVTRQIEALLTGSNYPAINSGDVRALQIPFPDYKEQGAIAAVLSDMDAEIAALEAKLAKARGIKQGMMQELLTGRIRLI
jgi:type I restriction enzyme S subunit